MSVCPSPRLLPIRLPYPNAFLYWPRELLLVFPMSSSCFISSAIPHPPQAPRVVRSHGPGHHPVIIATVTSWGTICPLFSANLGCHSCHRECHLPWVALTAVSRRVVRLSVTSCLVMSLWAKKEEVPASGQTSADRGLCPVLLTPARASDCTGGAW